MACDMFIKLTDILSEPQTYLLDILHLMGDMGYAAHK